MAEAGLLEQSPSVDPVTSAEVVVGIPSFNNASTIGAVIKSTSAGIHEHFGGRTCAIIQADPGSSDGTLQEAREAAASCPLLQLSYPLYPVHKLSFPYHGVPGRTVAIETIFRRSGELSAAACAVISPDLSDFTPLGVEALIKPVIDEQIDFVAPLYLRHPCDGALISGLVYPLTRVLFGKRLRYAIATDFAVSRRLLEHCLDQNIWSGDISAEVWLPAEALSGDFKIGQALLGPKPVPKDATTDLVSMLNQVVGPVFSEMQKRAAVWQKSRPPQAIPVFGLRSATPPEPVTISTAPMIESFRLACQTLPDVWSIVLPPATLLMLKKLVRVPEAEFRFPDDLWARTVYDFALGYRLRSMGRDHLLGALAPIYLAWLASFANETQKATAEEAEARLETICLAFESQKPYLISRWRWPDRFNP